MQSNPHERLEDLERQFKQGGMSRREFLRAAALLGLSERTAKRNWAYARAWLARELKEQAGA